VAVEQKLERAKGAVETVEREPIELLEEALRVVDAEPLKAVELALLALKGLKPSFEASSLERALRAHGARIRLEGGEGLRQAVKELKTDPEELRARAERA